MAGYKFNVYVIGVDLSLHWLASFFHQADAEKYAAHTREQYKAGGVRVNVLMATDDAITQWPPIA